MPVHAELCPSAHTEEFKVPFAVCFLSLTCLWSSEVARMTVQIYTESEWQLEVVTEASLPNMCFSKVQ